MVRDDARAELRIVRRADDVRRRAAIQHHLPLVWLKMRRISIFLAIAG
jgi:hypothetical protein